MIRYIIRRKADGLFYCKGRDRFTWDNNPDKAKLFTNSGHCRNALAINVPWDLEMTPKLRSVTRAIAFNKDYTIIPIQINVKDVVKE